jgi:hypothetical protein
MDNQKENKIYCTQLMNFGVIFFGLMAVFFGLFFLAKNLGFLNISIPSLTVENVWPLFLIFAGLSFLNAKNILTKILGVIFTLIIAFVCMGLFFYKPISERLSSVVGYRIGDASSISESVELCLFRIKMPRKISPGQCKHTI